MILAHLVAMAHASPTLDFLQAQLDPVVPVLTKRDEPLHYLALTVTDEHQIRVSARSGTLANQSDKTFRRLDIDLRVGTPELDSTHPLRGFSSLTSDGRQPIRLPVDEGYASAHRIRREIDERYREAAEHLVVLRANQNVLVEEETQADDFDVQPARKGYVDIDTLELDQAAWSERLVTLSKHLTSLPWVHEHQVALAANRTVHHMVDTEGSRLQHGRTHARLSIQLSTTVDDGDVLSVFDAIDVHDPTTLPTDLDPWLTEQIEKLEALRAAPRGEPTGSPVLLTGRAAGVFLHEVIGHRVEGHRQKREDEGKTFASKIGERILPEGVDIIDDPTLARLADTDLNGHYDFDDEGIAAQPATLVEDGVFEGFLMGRSPLPTQTTNGHGRRSSGRAPISRMGNTVLTADNGLSNAELRARLLRAVRDTGAPYGVIVEDIEGGFALTGRQMPNAFNIRAVASRRVYADGRPDEWVRGIDLVGTPFQAFASLIAIGDTTEVFNGTCGAESGWVPVSAASPPLLFERLEFQLKEKGQRRPPLLDKPIPSSRVN